MDTRITSQNTTIGFIGTGVMGGSMAGHLLTAGYRLHLHTRTRSKAEKLLDAGAAWREAPKDLCPDCDVIFTMVGFPSDVEEVYFGSAGLLPFVRPGCVLVDLTTSSPALAVRIAEGAEAKGARALDAPVSGGDSGAREAALSIMAGGDRAAFEHLDPLWNLMGKQIVYQGPAGSGQHCKMCNQLTVAANMIGVCEALTYAEKSGLDPVTVLKSISSGAAGSWLLSNLAPRILEGDYAPGFYVKHFIKDMGIALESASALGADLPGLELALSLYRRLADEGYGDEGTQALARIYGSVQK